MELIGVFWFWLGCGVLAFIVANAKNRGAVTWAILGFLFGPLGLLAAAGMPKIEASASSDSTLRPCPQCAEPIKKLAVKCRCCGSAVDPIA